MVHMTHHCNNWGAWPQTEGVSALTDQVHDLVPGWCVACLHGYQLTLLHTKHCTHRAEQYIAWGRSRPRVHWQAPDVAPSTLSPATFRTCITLPVPQVKVCGLTVRLDLVPRPYTRRAHVGRSAGSRLVLPPSCHHLPQPSCPAWQTSSSACNAIRHHSPCASPVSARSCSNRIHHVRS